jgi:DNA-directed RNA polymerase subunit N (RpoN/RPB10)
MLIPVKCFTCGKVLADLYRYFITEVRKMKAAKGKHMEVDNVIYLTKVQTDKTPEGEVMDRLNLHKICCRRHMLTHVDIE